MKTKKKFYRVDRKKIGFIKFILEAYGGIAVLTTIDARAGKIVIIIAPGCEQTVELIMQDLNKTIMIESICIF